jgi:molybdopterin-guanine dinucleotide biosynthesis protein A
MYVPKHLQPDASHLPTLSVGRCGSGFVLAGGQSSRMGTDKALALFNGIPLVQNALQTLAAASLPAQIAGSRSSLAKFAEEIPDTFPESGPLGGIHAALAASHADLNLFLPVDLPLMPPPLLLCLLQRAQLTGAPVTVAKLNGRVEPFPVVLHRSTLAQVAQRLQSVETACHTAWQTIPPALNSLLDAVSVENLIQCGQCSHPLGLPPFLWFQSANTPEELAWLNHIRASRDPIPKWVLK